MATTTNYGWTTPDDTALVKDGAAAIRTLGSSVDTTTKNLNPETTLGDLAYRSSTANVKTRLGLGTAGQVLAVNSGATAPEWTTPAASVPANTTAYVAAPQTTTSGDWTDLATAGPAVTLTTGTKALVIITSYMKNNTSGRGAQMSFVVSGATSLAADTARSLWIVNNSSADIFLQSSACYLVTLTAGSNTFTAKYQRTGGGGTAEFGDRYITVINMA